MTLTALSLSEQLLTRLRTMAAVNVFDAMVDLPDYDVDDSATHKFWDLDDAGRVENVHAYAVLWPSPGSNRSQTLDQIPDTLDATFQITCVGGDRTRALWCVGKVRSVMAGFRVVNAHGQPVLVVEAPGDPGPVREDRNVSPSRHYVPLLFTVSA